MIEVLLGRWRPREWFILLLAAESVLLLVDLYMHFLAPWPSDAFIHRLLDITLEVNLPTLYSSAQAWLAGLAALAVARVSGRRGWQWVGGFFLFLGFDDLFRLHEQFGTLMGEMAQGDGEASDFFLFEWLRAFRSYYWHLVAAPLFIAAGVAMFIYLWRAFTERAFLLTLFAGLGCYAVAMGLDFFDGNPSNYWPLLEVTGLKYIDAQHLERAFEEFLEMFGTTLIFLAFLRQWRAYSPTSAA